LSSVLEIIFKYLLYYILKDKKIKNPLFMRVLKEFLHNFTKDLSNVGYKGTSYRAANWIYLGKTKARNTPYMNGKSNSSVFLRIRGNSYEKH
jgi:hypothetical protein